MGCNCGGSAARAAGRERQDRAGMTARVAPTRQPGKVGPGTWNGPRIAEPQPDTAVRETPATE